MLIITTLTAVLNTYMRSYRNGNMSEKEALDKGFGACDFAVEIAGDEALESTISGIWEEYQKAF